MYRNCQSDRELQIPRIVDIRPSDVEEFQVGESSLSLLVPKSEVTNATPPP